jgi:Domain of unknown function (DUF4384)
MMVINMFRAGPSQLKQVCFAAALLAASSANAQTRGLLTQPKTENSSDVSVEMTGRSVNAGTEMSFRVSVAKPGYVMLVDIDAEGKMSQIYPRPELLARFNAPDMNLVKPGAQLQIPTEEQKLQGFKYLVGPPIGSSTVVAILSEKRVQLLDLPDLPHEVKSQADVISSLAKWMDQLRIPDTATGKLEQTNWSIAVKPYAIK